MRFSKLVHLFFLASVVFFVGSLKAADHYLLDVPLDEMSGTTLVELAVQNAQSLPDNFKLKTKFSPSYDNSPLHGVSCWIWIQRAVKEKLSSEDNRLECRWIYGNYAGLGVLSIRLPEAVVSPIQHSANALNFKLRGKSLRALSLLLNSNKDTLIKDGLATVSKTSLGEVISLVQSDDRFPQLKCLTGSDSCSFDFHKKPEGKKVSLKVGLASTDLVRAMLVDPVLSKKLLSVPDIREYSADQVESADCVFSGEQPERGVFVAQVPSTLSCLVDVKSNKPIVALSLDLSATATQSWGNKWQRFDAVALMGETTELLYKALRAYAEKSPSEFVRTDDVEVGNTYKSVDLTRSETGAEFLDLSIQCKHEIYRDPFTVMYQKNFPETYLGRIEYYKCLFKGEMQ
ncbi:hypothetical protein GW915_06835 [bacterium]|nr:hypothetical protein [bacterium]